jgi:hypothetical protein
MKMRRKVKLLLLIKTATCENTRDINGEFIHSKLVLFCCGKLQYGSTLGGWSLASQPYGSGLSPGNSMWDL